ncbi:hypothetical protein GCM10010156_13290 [Planobispora rosea]|uniref:DUF418 domain-containing protein n=1 Tax=Planobispora rosea TaxID=35762 RepID=A0A8J3WB72_PLARO|nr:DUF418 domain-containing protein [Planobispora rosea]GGS56067.1 hypothetical protein GCM10010156_13290 [Planobispora rosea]GIH83599.1 hypothetical protein Pro02_20070 [Planobispora rosea]
MSHETLPPVPEAAGPGRPETTSSGRPRLAALDVLCGFALCGILIANVKPIAHLGGTAPVTQSVVAGHDDAWLGLLVDQRFFPIFSLLFGVGFSLLLDSAGRRVPGPRVLLLRRLLVLLAVGLGHMFLLWRGDILTIYAIVGLLVLLPSTWLPRRAVAGLAAVLIAAPLILGGNGVPLVPGLFLLGSALTRYGVVDRLEHSVRVPAVLGLILTAGAVPALWLQTGTRIGEGAFNLWFALAGLLIAGSYVCALLLLLKTPLRPVLQTVFAPLGRMALTNYLSATVLVLMVTRLVGGSPDGWSSATVLLVAGAVLIPQWLVSTLWLRRYRQGPLEWLWRWATWAHRPPLRRTPDAEAGGPAPDVRTP